MIKKRFFKNAAILSFTSLLMNTVGMSFNIYISNEIGASGVGLFGLIMSVYGFSTTLATSGINLAATRLIADETASSFQNAASYVLKKCLLYALCFGLFSFSVLFFSADFIATNLLLDERTLIPLKALSISMPPIAMSSALSGYFLAVGRVFKSSSAQIFEQIFKMVLSFILLETYAKGDIERACLTIVFSGSISEICSFLYLFILYYFDKKRYSNNKHKKNTLSSILKISVPIALSSYLRSLLVTIEHILIPRGLKKSGMDSESALKSYGIIHGMAIPLLLFPSGILRSVSSLLIPELSQCSILGRKREINRIASKILKTSLIFSILASGIFFCFADEIGLLVYKSRETALYIRLLSPLCVIMYVDSMVDAMLKGLNQQVNSMFYNIFDSIISIFSILILLPKFQSGGYIAVIYISEIVNAFLSLSRLIKITDFYVEFFSWIVLPSVCIYGAGNAVRLFEKMFFLMIDANIFSLCIKIIACSTVYIFLLYFFSKTKRRPL